MSPAQRDARTRALRTFRQGLVASVAVGGCTGLLHVLQGGAFSWSTVGIAVLTGSLTAGCSYVERALIDPRRSR